MKPPRLLIIEDDANLRLGLADNLRDEGYEVHLATSAREAEPLVREHAFELLLLDVMLPGMSGYDVVRTLRADGDSVPVLMLSAKDGVHDQADGLDLEIGRARLNSSHSGESRMPSSA